jgi:two-component system invasion response regulator UvrY
MKWRIYIVEDHEVVRQSYVMFLNMSSDLEVCGAVRTAEEALEDVPEANPDLLVVDVSLPGMSGIDLLEALRASDRLVPALVLSGHDNEVYRDTAVQAGARAFVMKQEGPDALLDAIYRALGAANERAE